MKKTTFIIVLFFGVNSFAQNNGNNSTNFLPTNGNVGVGTTNPTATLDVNGTMRVEGDMETEHDLNVEGALTVHGITTLDNSVLMPNISSFSQLAQSTDLLIVDTNGDVKKVNLLGLSNYLGILGDALACQTDPNGDILQADWVNGVNKVYVCPNVNVGIGEQNPAFELHIDGITATDRLLVGNDLGTVNAVINGFVTNPNIPIMELGQKIGTGAIDVRFSVKNSGAIEISNSSSDASMTINNGTGNALVVNGQNGTKILQLEDNGLLRARHVRVDLANWADYVFEENYDLMPLSEVETYIHKNKHLPNVPSEAELKEEGMDLEDMSRIQMEKIEEMYLHVIELNKQMIVLRQENESLKNELRKLNNK